MEEKLKEYTENLPWVRKEVEIRAVDLFKQSPAFDAFTHADFVGSAAGCRDLLRHRGYKEAMDVVDKSLKKTGKQKFPRANYGLESRSKTQRFRGFAHACGFR